ncbi:MAG: YlbF family regulator [Christensenellales bacterium]
MQIYDKTRELAELIRNCPEFVQYKEFRDKVYCDDTTKALLKEYKRLQIQAQSAYLGGQALSGEITEKLQKIASILQFNPDAMQFMLAEHRFLAIVGDVYKILGDAAEVDLGFLAE